MWLRNNLNNSSNLEYQTVLLTKNSFLNESIMAPNDAVHDIQNSNT